MSSSRRACPRETKFDWCVSVRTALDGIFVRENYGGLISRSVYIYQIVLFLSRSLGLFLAARIISLVNVPLGTFSKCTYVQYTKFKTSSILHIVLY